MESFDYPDTWGSDCKVALIRLLAYLNSLPLSSSGDGHDEIERIAADLGRNGRWGPEMVKMARKTY